MVNDPAPPAPLMRISEVAEELGVTTQRVYQMIAEGTIPAARISPRCVRVPRGAWEAWLAAHADRALASFKGKAPAGAHGDGGDAEA